MRFLIVGAGGAGNIHVRELTGRGLDVAVWDTNTQKAAALAEATGATLAEGPDVEAEVAVVAVPACSHVDAVVEQFEFGRQRVVCEKPLALLADDAEYLVSLYGSRLLIAESQAYAGEDCLALLRLREEVRAGYFGDGGVSWWVRAMTSYRPQAWCNDLAVGGGAFLEGGIHVATVARVLFGEATGWFGSVRCLSGGTAPDTGTIVIDYEGGHQLVLQLAWGTEGAFSGECPPVGGGAGLIGAKRCLTWWQPDNHHVMWTHLLRCLRGEAEPVARVEDAALAVGDVWKCYEWGGIRRSIGARERGSAGNG